MRKQQWDWVPSIDQMPLWGNVASDEGVQAALRDAREAKQFPSNFLKPKNRLAGESWRPYVFCLNEGNNCVCVYVCMYGWMYMWGVS